MLCPDCKGPMKPDDLPSVVSSKIITEPNSGCWFWLGGVQSQGYGMVHYEDKHWLTHRLTYTIANNIEPIGLDVDHKCRNTLCVNPAHLDAVTHEENMRRSPLGFNSSKTQSELARRFRPNRGEQIKKGWETRRKNALSGL